MGAKKTDFKFGVATDTQDITGEVIKTCKSHITREELENDSVLGWLTAEEVFKRFKYCFENDSSIYCDEGK